MKRLSTLLIITLALGISSISYAQSFGVQAGFNLSNMLAKNDLVKSSDYNLAPGFHFGGVAEMPITEMFSVEGKLLFSTKGFNYKTSSSNVKVNCFLFYTEIPIMAKANFEIGNVGVFGLLGPYMGIGLTGRVKQVVGSDKETETIKWGSNGDEDDFKRFDFGMAIGGGVEVGVFQFGINYNLGLANISAYTDNGTKYKNRTLSFFAVFLFGN